MGTRKSATIIFGRLLILGFMVVPSCLALTNNEQPLSPQTVPNGAVLDTDTQSNLVNTLSTTEQQLRICSMPNLSIPDLGARSHTIPIANSFTLSDLDVYLNILHPYVGDLKITLDHSGGFNPVTLIDKLRCGGSNVDVIINDEGIDGDVANQCDDAPAIHGDRVGGNPPLPVLSTFDGNNISGDWVLTITDNGRGDTGTLVEWCLIPSPSCYTLTITHSGEGSDPVASLPNSNGCAVGEYVPGESISLSGAIAGLGWQISSWNNTDNDISIANTNTVTMPTGNLTASVNYQKIDSQCKFTFTGNDSLTGSTGNIKTFLSTNGVSVNVSGWSSESTTHAFDPAYVGAYAGGLGVTDIVSDGDGSNEQHTLENIGAYDYLLFEFDQSIIPNQIYLGYVVNDSDLRIWLGYLPSGENPHTNHQSLSSDLLNILFTEPNSGNDSVRWADINAGNEHGNILIVATKTDDVDDHILIEQLMITCLK